jgi:5'-3' exoribonuclease 2
VIHGLDADLIMLALATHEPHFFILREEVTFAKAAPSAEQKFEAAVIAAAGEATAEPAPELIQHSKPFQMVKVSVFREYLDKELSQADYSAVGGFSLERAIDDFVLMVAFVGNDFLPHLPSLEIREGAIDTILDIYKASFPELGGCVARHACYLPSPTHGQACDFSSNLTGSGGRRRRVHVVQVPHELW